jgi:hypothetical protein
MSAFVAIILGLFFVIGMTVGVISVMAMAAVRSDRRAGGSAGHEPSGRGGQPSEPDGDEWDSGERSSWPGDSASRYRAS